MFPCTASPPLIWVGTKISKPLFGEIIANAEPDFNLSISPIADAGILNIPLPSPLKNDALTEPLIWVLPLNSKLTPLAVTPITFVCTPEAEKGPTTFTEADEKLAILLPLTNNETKDELS